MLATSCFSARRMLRSRLLSWCLPSGKTDSTEYILYCKGDDEVWKDLTISMTAEAAAEANAAMATEADLPLLVDPFEYGFSAIKNPKQMDVRPEIEVQRVRQVEDVPTPGFEKMLGTGKMFPV